jgi:hypothetical protein
VNEKNPNSIAMKKILSTPQPVKREHIRQFVALTLALTLLTSFPFEMRANFNNFREAPTRILEASKGTHDLYVALRWQPVAGAKQYRIRRAEIGKEEWQVLETLQNLRFHDTDARYNRKYKYCVTALLKKSAAAAPFNPNDHEEIGYKRERPVALLAPVGEWELSTASLAEWTRIRNAVFTHGSPAKQLAIVNAPPAPTYDKGPAQRERRILHVKSGAGGSGANWSDALGDLQAALRLARPDDEIWVAAGIYRPTKGEDRQATFAIPDSVRLFGGFAGIETSLNQRNMEKYPSILSGEIGRPGKEDNVYSVVTTCGVSAATLLDGFIITGGAANATGEKHAPTRAGGGWYNDAGERASNPTIVNCIFHDNHAQDGAALFNRGIRGEASPTISHTLFIANQADWNGGAIFNYAIHGQTKPKIMFSIFRENKAAQGASICNHAAWNGNASPSIQRGAFVKNSLKEAAIYNLSRQNGITRVELIDCWPANDALNEILIKNHKEPKPARSSEKRD